MGKSIAQLNKEIAMQRKQIAKEQDISKRIAEQQKLSQELFKLKQRKLISAGAKAKRLTSRLGRGLLKVGKKIDPVIKKQARLIREQQLRDDAIARARAKQTTRTKKKSRKKVLRRSEDEGIFGTFDF